MKMLPYKSLNEKNIKKYSFPCRGCTMKHREEKWYGFLSSIGDEFNRSIDNSYLTLELEPTNRYDPNAIMVVVRGEFFGTAGYVGREFTGDVKKILDKCEGYRLDMADETEAGKGTVSLILSWTEKKNGRKNKKEVVAEWQAAHPDGKKIDCVRDTGLSKPTVRKWWK